MQQALASRDDGLAGSAPAKTIRVIEVRRNLVDPTTAGQEELALILTAARDIPALADSQQALLAFLDIARDVQGNNAPLLDRNNTRDVIDPILVRDLLANPAVRPIFTTRGVAANAESVRTEPVIHTRPAARTRAVDLRGQDSALATEEPVNIVGFAVDPLASGLAIIRERPFLGRDVYATSGSYTTVTMAAAGDVHPPTARFPDEPPRPGSLEAILQARRFKPVMLSKQLSAVPTELLRQSRAAIDFYYSGAATAIVFAGIAAAVRGAPGAPPALLAALGPVINVLGQQREPSTREPSTRATATATWRDPVSTSKLRYLIDRLAYAAPIAAADPGTWSYDLSPLSDLYRVGALGMYLFALTEGRESARLDDFFEQILIRHVKTTKLRDIERMIVVASARARMYITIIQDKFGFPRARAVLDALRTVQGARSRGAPGGSMALPSDRVQVDDPDAVIALLSKREREIVLTEYDNRQKEWVAASDNKCPHVAIARRLRGATSAADASKHLRELTKYFVVNESTKRGNTNANAGANADASTNAVSWLMCRSCGFRALCPHVRDRIQLEARRASFDEMRTRLAKYAVRISNRDSDDSHSYYCSICSERVADVVDADNSSETLGRFGDLDAGLRTKIWAIALGAARHIRFPAPTDERQFASTTAAVVYPLLMAAEAAVIKRGRRRKQSREPAATGADYDDEELDARTMLYIILFVYAHILNIIQTSSTARAQEIGFVGVKRGARMSSYAEAMLRLIADTHRGIIAQIEDVSAEYLAARFTEAFRIVRGDDSGARGVAKPEEELAIQTTTVDPIYRYAATVARVSGDLPIDRPVGPAAARREFETVLGDSLPDIIKNARVSAREPDLAPLYIRRTGAEVPPGGAFEYLLKDPRVNLYAKLYEPKPNVAGVAAEKAFKAIAAAASVPVTGIRYWVGAGVRRKQPKRDRPGRRAARALDTRPDDDLAAAQRGSFFESYRLFVRYTRDMVNHEAFVEYQRDLAVVRRSEDGIRVARALSAVKPYYDFGWKRSQQYEPVHVPITAVYDENGARHDWSKLVTYVFKGDDGKELLVHGGPKAVAAARAAGDIESRQVVDLECPVCGVRASQINTLDPEVTEANVRAVSELDSFFVFYESRCPEGELHEWAPSADTTRCRKCELGVNVMHIVTSGNAAKDAEARTYHAKYAKQFVKDRHEIRSIPPSTATSVRPKEISTDAAAFAAAWVPDYTSVVRAAELAGVTPATIESIGATEGREYESIVDGQGVPDPPTSPSDPRLFTSDAEVRLFLADYGVLRYAQRFSKLPLVVSELLAAANVPKHEWGLLPKYLPDVGIGYRAQFAAMAAGRSPAITYTFAIHSLCRMVLEVAAVTDGPDWVNRLAVMFAKQELITILHNHKLFSKPGAFNWSVFDDAEGGDVEDQVGDVGEDVLEELLENEGEEAPEDPFSGENMDYDTGEGNPNNEAA